MYPMFGKLVGAPVTSVPDVTTTTHLYHVDDECHMPLLEFSCAALTIDWIFLTLFLVVIVYSGIRAYRDKVRCLSFGSCTFLKGCDSNFEVNSFQVLKVAANETLPCIKQYVLG